MLDENLQVIHYSLESLKVVFEALAFWFDKNHSGVFFFILMHNNTKLGPFR